MSYSYLDATLDDLIDNDRILVAVTSRSHFLLYWAVYNNNQLHYLTGNYKVIPLKMAVSTE